MKKLIILLITLFSVINTQAQSSDKVIKDTTINKIVYHIYQGSRGKYYIVVTSKTGNQYKKYLKR